MSSLTKTQIEAALETLNTSYTYDPPSRWMASYSELRGLHHEMDEWLRPYSWIVWACFALGLAGLAFQFMRSSTIEAALPTDNFLINAIIYTTAWSIPVALMTGGYWLALTVAARRHPLLKFKTRVEAATRRFHDLAGKPSLEDEA